MDVSRHFCFSSPNPARFVSIRSTTSMPLAIPPTRSASDVALLVLQTEEDTSRVDRADTEEDTEDTRVAREATASSSTAPPRASTAPSREATSAEPPTASSSSRADRPDTARDSRAATKCALSSPGRA